MALSKTSMAAAIKQQMIKAGAQDGEHSWLDTFCEAVASGVVEEITSKAVVTTKVVIASGSSAGTYTGTGAVQ